MTSDPHPARPDEDPEKNDYWGLAKALVFLIGGAALLSWLISR